MPDASLGLRLHHLTADGRQSESQAQRLQRQLLAGLGHLHQRGRGCFDLKLPSDLLEKQVGKLRLTHCCQANVPGIIHRDVKLAL